MIRCLSGKGSKQECYITITNLSFGEVGVLWNSQKEILRLILPRKGREMRTWVRECLTSVKVMPPEGKIKELVHRLLAYDRGKEVDFADFVSLPPGFGGRILQETGRIPQGKVATYGYLAIEAGIPRGARAVGRILARNPFPLIVPCHRVVKSDGFLGGFSGGYENGWLKRFLLAREGVLFDPKWKVLGNCMLKTKIRILS